MYCPFVEESREHFPDTHELMSELEKPVSGKAGNKGLMDLNVSIGTQSLMHPVDWLEINSNNGFKQTLPDCFDDGKEWFECGDLSFLKTPLDRKSRVLYKHDEEDEDEECYHHDDVEDTHGGYVVHNVSTDLTFLLGTMSLAEKHVAITHALQMSRNDTKTSPADLTVPYSAMKRIDMHDTNDELHVPFSAVKPMGDHHEDLQVPFSAVKCSNVEDTPMSAFGLVKVVCSPVSEDEDEDDGMHRPRPLAELRGAADERKGSLARSKRSLFVLPHDADETENVSLDV